MNTQVSGKETGTSHLVYHLFWGRLMSTILYDAVEQPHSPYFSFSINFWDRACVESTKVMQNGLLPLVCWMILKVSLWVTLDCLVFDWQQAKSKQDNNKPKIPCFNISIVFVILSGHCVGKVNGYVEIIFFLLLHIFVLM